MQQRHLAIVLSISGIIVVAHLVSPGIVIRAGNHPAARGSVPKIDDIARSNPLHL